MCQCRWNSVLWWEFLTSENVRPIDRHRRMKVVSGEECVDISALRLQLLVAKSYSQFSGTFSEFMLTGTTVRSERDCQRVAKLNARLRRVRPHMEQPLLHHDNAQPQQSREQLQRFDALGSPSWITDHVILSWRLRIFITSGDEIGVKLWFCLQGAQFCHDGLWNYLNVGESVWIVKVIMRKNSCVEVKYV
jgi:hypothetical protein